VAGLSLDLQEGFEGEAVEVLLDGRTVWRGRPRTNWSIGLAERVELTVPPAGADLTVAVGGRGPRLEERLAADHPPHIGVSLEGGRLTARRSQEPFTYF
jgi:hypothetical protein